MGTHELGAHELGAHELATDFGIAVAHTRLGTHGDPRVGDPRAGGPRGRPTGFGVVEVHTRLGAHGDPRAGESRAGVGNELALRILESPRRTPGLGPTGANE